MEVYSRVLEIASCMAHSIYKIQSGSTNHAAGQGYGIIMQQFYVYNIIYVIFVRTHLATVVTQSWALQNCIEKNYIKLKMKGFLQDPPWVPK